MSPDAQRAHVAWLMWCFNEGYVNAVDRVGMKNWLLDDPAKLHPDDAALRPHLLAMADELIAAMQSEAGSTVPRAAAKAAAKSARKNLRERDELEAETVLSDRGTKSPWSAERVTNLNEFQLHGRLHPYTCLNRTRETHKQRPGERDFGLLVATPGGWVCRDCDYTQDWM